MIYVVLESTNESEHITLEPWVHTGTLAMDKERMRTSDHARHKLHISCPSQLTQQQLADQRSPVCTGMYNNWTSSVSCTKFNTHRISWQEHITTAQL